MRTSQDNLSAALLEIVCRSTKSKNFEAPLPPNPIRQLLIIWYTALLLEGSLGPVKL